MMSNQKLQCERSLKDQAPYIYTCSVQSFKILASFCSWADWFESYLVENPKETFSHDVA